MKDTCRSLLIALLANLCCFAFGHLAFAQNNAIARLNYAGFKDRGSCTATLVTKNAALTARHCTFKYSKNQMHLLFGYARSEWAEHHRIKSIHRHKSRDIAILCLNKRSNVKPMAIAARPAGKMTTTVSLATATGYRRSRPHLPTSETCTFQAAKTRARFSCKLEPGMSGAPVMQNGQLVGIVSGTTATYTLIELAVDLPELDCGG